MRKVHWWQRLQLVRLLSLVFLVLAGCGGSSSPGNSPTSGGTSRVLLQVMLENQASASSSTRAVDAAQVRQTGREVSRVRVAVQGAGLALPLVVECVLPGPSTPQCRITVTPTAFIIEVEVLVVVGRERTITVTVLDEAGMPVLQGGTQVDLLQPVEIVTIALRSTNTAPVANAGTDQTVTVGTTVILRGEGSSDAEGNALTFAWALLLRPPGSQAVLTNPTSVNPTFAVDRPGNYMAQLTVSDGSVDSAPDTVEVTTRNSAPRADAGAPQAIQVGVLVTLQGDRSSDVDGDALTFRWTLLTRPPGSQAVLTNPTSVNPTLVPDRRGTYVAELVVDDGQTSSVPATVTLTTGNVPPIAQAGPPQTAVRGATVQLNGSGSSDADGDALTFAWSLTTRPLGSTATLNNPTSVNPTLVLDQLGVYVAQLIVNDGTADSVPDTVRLTTGNAAPIADAGLPQTAPVGTVVRLDGRGSRDPDNDPLTFTWALLVRPPGSSTALVNPTSAQPSFRVDLPGTYVAQLRVNDGLQDSAPATVTIDTVNSRPVAQAGAAQQVLVGATVVLDGRASSDTDSDPLTFSWSLTVRPPGSIATLQNPTTAQPSFVGDLPGVFVAQLFVNDGVLDSAPATVSITVVRLLNPPVANAGPDQVVGQRVLVPLDGRGSSDPDGEALTFRWVQIAGPGVSLDNATTAQPSFTTPDVTVDTVLRFQLVVNDGTTDGAPDTVDITVLSGANHAPAAFPIAVSALEDSAVLLVLTANDADAGTTLSLNIVSGPSQGTLGPLSPVVCLPEEVGVGCRTAVTYTPAPNYNGPDSVTFQASDGVLSSTIVTASLTLQPVNDAPVAVDDTYVTMEDNPLTLGAPGLLANDQEVDGDPLAALLLTGPTNGQVVLQADGSFTYTPAPNYTGPDQFTYQVTDGVLTSNPATVSLTVTGVNDFPLAQNDAYTTVQDIPLIVLRPGVLANDNDAEDGSTALTAVLVTPPAQGTLDLAADGSFTYTPPRNFTGPTSFTYQAQDTAGVLSNVATAIITVTPVVNNAPVALNDQYTTDEDTVLTVAAPGVLGNDTDAEGNPLTALLVAPPLRGTLNLAPDGSFVYTPNQDVNDSDSFMYKANDGTNDSNPAVVTLTINPVNDAPSADAGAAQNVATGTLVTLDGRGSSDVEGATLTFAWTLTNVPPGSLATLTNPATATPTFTPDLVGNYTAQLVVNDGSLNSRPATVVLTAAAPSVRLALVGTALVGVGRTAMIQATLTAPAPAGGVTVTVSSDAPTTLTVTPPGTIIIAPGGTTGQVNVNGVQVGAALVRGNAPGYTEGTLTVPVSLNLISLPATLNIPFGQTVSAPVTIAPTPAPVGGVVVALVSSDPTKVQVLTPTVTIPAGSQSANGTVQGAGIGPATLTASNVNFSSATAQATTTASLDILQTNATVNGDFSTPITVRFLSASVIIPAPAPGITVTLTATDPGCVAVTSPVTIPTGQASVAATLTYGGSTTRPCTTTVTASAPNLTADTVSVTANPVPAINVFPTQATVGAGLQTLCCTLLLGAPAPPGGVLVQLSSSDATKILLAPNTTTVGTATLTLPIAAGATSASFVVQGLERAAPLPSTVTITASAPRYTNGSNTVTVVQPAFNLVGLLANLTTLAPDAPFRVFVGIPSGNGVASQEVRIGGQSLTATVRNSAAQVAQLTTSAGAAQSRTVQIPPGQSSSPITVAAGGIAFDPLNAGTTTVTATIPGFLATPAATVAVTIAAPALTVSPVASTVGAGLQNFCCTINLETPAPPGGLLLQVSSSDATKVLLAPNTATAGTATLTLPIAAGVGTVSLVVQGLESATPLPSTVTLTVSTPGYTNGTHTVTVVQPVFSLVGLLANLTTLAPDAPFLVQVGVPLGNGISTQAVRIGGSLLTATVANSAARVAQLTTSAGAAQSRTVQIPPGQFSSPNTVAGGGVAFDPLSAGTTTVTATIPGLLATPQATVAVTITAPAITVSPAATTVGAGLQELCCSVILETPAPAGGLLLQVRSSDATKVLLAPNLTTAGTPTLTLPVAAGSANASFVVHGLESATPLPSTVTLTVSAPSYTDGTSTATVVQAALQLVGVPTAITTLSSDDPFQVVVGLPVVNGVNAQQVRIGGQTLTATVSNSVGRVAQLITSAGAAQSRTVQIQPGQDQSPVTVVAGGIAFDPLTAGNTTVTASIPGLLATPQATVAVTVSAPAINVSPAAATVGAGLQDFCCTVSLGAPAPPGGVQVQITSSDPGSVLLAPNLTTGGVPVLTLPVAAGSSTASFAVVGLETAPTLPATVVLTVTAAGYIDGSNTVTVVQPGVEIRSLATAIGVTALDDPFLVRVGIPVFNNAQVSTQQVRIGGPTLTATITNSSAAVAQLSLSAGPTQTASVTIPPGQFSSPSTVGAGGVAFDPLTVGATTVRATIPAFVLTDAATVNVTVTP